MVLKLLVISGIAVSLEGIIEFFQGGRLFVDIPMILNQRYEIGNPLRFGVPRVFASFYDPVYYGTYIGLIAIIALGISVYSNRRQHKLMAGFQIILTPFVLLFAQARTAVLTLGIIALFWIFNESRQLILRVLYRLAVVTLILIIVLAGTNILEELRYTFNEVVFQGVVSSSALDNLKERMMLNALAVSLSWPINLVGERTPEIIDKFYTIAGSADVGNGFIWLLSSEGLFPALVHYGLVVWFLVVLFRLRKRGFIVRYLMLGLLYFFIADQITAQLALNRTVWWILGGLAMCIKHIYDAQRQSYINESSSISTRIASAL